MTDARFPERWLNDRRIMRLTDHAFRLFVTSLAWSASNRTEGYIDRDDLMLLRDNDKSLTDELVKADLWKPYRDGWIIRVFATSQATRAQLEGVEYKRWQDRERQARHRRKKRAKSTNNVPQDITRYVTRDTKDRTGQDRTQLGEAESNAAKTADEDNA